MTDAPVEAAERPRESRLSFGAGLLLLATITVFWGVNWPMMKVAVTEVPIWTFRSICLLGAAIGFLVICRLAGQSLRIPRGQVGPLLVSSLFNVTIWHICSATGLVHLAASRPAGGAAARRAADDQHRGRPRGRPRRDGGADPAAA
jgi:EamA-like transporter family